MTVPTPPHPDPPRPWVRAWARLWPRPWPRPRLAHVAPWVDLFFKLSAGMAASIAIWRAFQ